MKTIVHFIFIACVFFSCVERQPRRPVSQSDAARVRRTRGISRPAAHVPTRADASVPVLLPVGRDYRPEIVRAYRLMIRPDLRDVWLAAIRRCTKRERGRLVYADFVQRAADLAGYPPAFVAGLAVHESFCNQRLVTGDGGVGLAQITPNHATGVMDASWVARATRLLGHVPDWRNDPTENLVLGLSALRTAEEEFGSRELALAAYNAGISGVYRAERVAGWREGRPLLPLKTIMRHLAHRRWHYDARRYAAKVLAAAILVDRVVRHWRLRISTSYPLSRIPGAMPTR